MKLAHMFRSMKTAAGQISAEDSTIRREYEAVRAQIARLLGAMRARSDIDAGIADLVAARGARWIQDHSLALTVLGGGLDVATDHRTVTRLPPRVPAGLDAAPITFDLLCALAPAFVKDGLRAIVAATPNYSPDARPNEGSIGRHATVRQAVTLFDGEVVRGAPVRPRGAR